MAQTRASQVGSETVQRQIKVAKLVMAARHLELFSEAVATEQSARDGLVEYVRIAEPGFREPSTETWRLVVAHLSVVAL